MVMDWKGYGIASGTILTFEQQKASKNLSEQNRSPGKHVNWVSSRYKSKTSTLTPVCAVLFEISLVQH
jgi:ribosomal protein L24E